MTKRTRTITFLICLLLFILIAPSAVLYSQGYRIDFEGKKIRQTGGLFLKILPKQADVYIDGNLNKRTDFFFGSVLLENLLPKKYKIEVKKEGYHSWGKTLEIEEKEVTEAKNIILFPQNINFSLLSNQVEQFWFSPDQRKIILLEEDKSSSPPSLSQSESSVKEKEKLGWALKLYDLNKNIKSHLIGEEDFVLFFPFAPTNGSSVGEEDISPKEVQLINLNFSEDSKKIYLEVSTDEEEIKYFTLEFDKVKPFLIESESPSPPVKDVIVYQQINNDIYFLDNFGYLFKVEKDSFFSTSAEASVNEEKLTVKPFPIKQETEYVLEIFQGFIFLREGEEDKSSSLPFAASRVGEEDKSSSSPFAIARENDNLYKFNPELKVFENFFERINSLNASPDNKKLVYFSDYEIWILFLNDKNDPPQKKAGEKLFLIRLSERITDVFWINSDYLIFKAGDKIKISEIDDRDRLNIIDVFETKKLPQNGSPLEMFFNQFDKKLYLLNGNNLYGFDALIL